MLASEYSWSKNDILNNVYFDELYRMVEKINARKLSDYKMQLAIIQNPHVKDPKQLWEVFEQTEKQNNPAVAKRSEKFDKQGFESLKAAMSSNPRIIIKE